MSAPAVLPSWHAASRSAALQRARRISLRLLAHRVEGLVHRLPLLRGVDVLEAAAQDERLAVVEGDADVDGGVLFTRRGLHLDGAGRLDDDVLCLPTTE